jgi:hypothetical protein
VRQEQVPQLDRMLTPERLDRLHIAFPHLQAVETDGQAHTIRDLAGRTLVTSHAGVRDCLSALGNQFPQTSTVASLVAGVCPDGPAAMELAPLVRDALFKMAMIGMADLASVAFDIATAPDDRPEAFRLARLDAEAGQTWTSNARHEPVSLNVVQRAILPDLDGTRSQAALVATVERHVADGRVRFQKDGQPIEAAGDIDNAIREHIASALAGLAKSGLLVAA